MSRGSVNRKHVTRKDVKRVQALIEHCLTQNMNKEEAVELISQVEIEPNFIKLVWQKLEEENQEFFKCYYAKMAWKQKMMLLSIFSEEQGEITGLTSSAPLPTFDGSHNPAVSSQANCNVGLTTIPSSFPTFHGLHSPEVLSQPNSIFDGSHNPSFLSQPNSIAGLTPFASLPTFDELHNPVDLSQPNFSFDGSDNLAVLSQPNSNVDLTEIASLPNFDGSHNLAVLPQPNSNVDLTEIAPFPTFDGSHNSVVLSQPNSNMAHLPPLPYYTEEQIQASLMPTNMEQPIYSSSYDGGAVDVSAYDKDNWISGPSSMLSDQSEDMGMIQRINREMIESWPEYSGFHPLN
ncbi:hypothetical protein HKD37_13G036467 [Glycine soja]